MRKRAMGCVDHEKKSEGVRVDHKEKSEGVKVYQEEKRRR